MTPLGEMELIEGDIVSEALVRGEHWDPHVYDVLEPYLSGTVIDVGANVGALTMRFAKRAPLVLAFEPNQEMAHCLNVNVPYNVTVRTRGIYSRPVRLAPRTSEHRSPSSWPWLPTEDAGLAVAEPFDTFNRVSAIKVDAQGADLHCLFGLRRLIVRDRPAVAFEFEKELAELHGHTWADYETALVGWGYFYARIKESSHDYLALPCPCLTR